MLNALEYKQILRDNRTGQFLTMDGDWTFDERSAANCLSASRLIQLRLEYADRELEIILKSPGKPDQHIAL